ncbi:MAG: helix-turn-helix domain-containing protein [Chlamydiia bacterium]|nr:helix-turn-helix domain-containing protein [Chlamydiia bacterium]
MHKIDDYLQIKEAAGKLGVSASTLRNWEKQGKLKAHRNPHNQYRLYKKSELDQLLNSIENSAKG